MVAHVLRVLARRWPIVVLGLLITAATVYGSYRVSPPVYHARALVLLLPSKAATVDGANPFLELSGLEQPASIVVAYFSSTSAKDDIAQRSPTAEFVVELDGSTRGPVIAVDVTDHSPQAALSLLSYLLQRLPAQLATLQQQVSTPPDAVIGSMPLAVDDVAEPVRAATIRLMAAALVVGCAATGVLAVAADSLLVRRRLRKESEAESDDGESESPRAPTDELLCLQSQH